MNELSLATASGQADKRSEKPFIRLAKYLFRRALTISATIGISIFLVVLLMNQSGFLDEAVATEVRIQAIQYVYSVCSDCYTLSSDRQAEIIQHEVDKRTEISGLNDPYWVRQLRWTWNILTFDWKNIRGLYGGSEYVPPQRTFWSRYATGDASLRALTIVLEYFPNTLLIIGTAFFLLFLVGIPIALRLSIHYGNRLDRLLTALAPISSIPSWAHGVLLVSVFAFQLHWLPSRGMNDVIPPTTSLGNLLAILRHMILPVLAILLSLFFQVIYSWRSYFMLHSMEDHVEVGQAKGLTPNTLQKRYILRPTLPYIITSFALLLLGFWQLTTALEYYFNWPGIGFLYIQALDTGDLIVSLGIVVIFAYLLGGIMLIMDLVYACVDPRIQVQSRGETRIKINKNSRLRQRTALPPLKLTFHPSSPSLGSSSLGEKFHRRAALFMIKVREVQSFLRDLLYYPSAVIGLGLILLFLLGSIASILAYLYGDREAWQELYTSSPSRYTRPALALPEWVNWFLRSDLPRTIDLDSREEQQQVQKLTEPNGSGGTNINITYSFDLPGGDFPEEILLYFQTENALTLPFVTPIWITPEGEEIALRSRSITPDGKYSLSEGIPRRLLNASYLPSAAIARPGGGGYPPFIYLLSDHRYETPIPVAGRYQLRLEIITFDPEVEFDARLLILGKVFGPCGTDNLRRDLRVPMILGLPVALGIGLLGASVTTFLSMLIAAVGVWHGGWVDTLTQRLTEFNLIMPVLAIGVLLSYYFQIGLLWILGIVILLNAFGGTTKAYRAAFLQIKESPYIEAAQAYGAGSKRIIFHYLVPRILPVLLPQLVSLVPGYVFLEATLAIFGVYGLGVPTWGSIIHDALTLGATRGHYLWVMQPVVLLLLVGLAFAMVGFALDRILNPRLRSR